MQAPAGTEEFFRNAGIGQAEQAGPVFFPDEVDTAEEVRARLSALGQRPSGNIIAESGAPLPEESDALRLLDMMGGSSRSAAPQPRRNPLAEAGVTSQDIELLRAIRRRRDEGVATPQETQLFNEILLKMESAYGPDSLTSGRDQIMSMAQSDVSMLPTAATPRGVVGADPTSQFLDAVPAANVARAQALSRQLDSIPQDRRPINVVATTPQVRQEDLGPLSDRALATYSPSQLAAAAASTRDPQVMQRILAAAQGQATPTTFADLVSGRPQRALDKSILDQFGRFVPSEKDRLSLDRLREQISILRQQRADTTGQELRRAQASAQRALAAKRTEELNKAIAKANRRAPRGLSKQTESKFAELDRQLSEFLAGRDAPMLKGATTANLGIVYQREYKNIRKQDPKKISSGRLESEAKARWNTLKGGILIKPPATGEAEAKAQEAKEKATSTFKNKIAAGRRALVTAENKFQEARQEISTSTDADDRPKGKEKINAQKRVLAAELNKVVRIYEQAISDGAEFTAEDLADYQAVKARAISLGE
tara:strand:- start:581 stop:2200 length:1620 start_codon:yes stop_codon:yes gene_type:complete